MASHDVQRHRTSKKELGDIRALVARDLADASVADYFETCRRKRNVIDYTRSHVATDTEAKEILEKATEFHEFVEAWIGSKFQALRR